MGIGALKGPEPMIVEQVLYALDCLADTNRQESLMHIAEHLHRLRMRSNDECCLSQREKVIDLLTWGLECLAEDYTGEAKSCLFELGTCLSRRGDGSITDQDRLTLADRIERIKHGLLGVNSDKAIYEAASCMGNTFRELTDPRALVVRKRSIDI